MIFADDQDTLLVGLGGNDYLFGGAGDDTLIGGAGKDMLTGGWGDNTFVFLSTIDSRPKGQRDVITDFWIGHDRINLTAVDANTSLLGDQAFAFATRAARNSVWFSAGVLSVDVNGDARADMQIEVTGITGLRATDLAL